MFFVAYLSKNELYKFQGVSLADILDRDNYTSTLIGSLGPRKSTTWYLGNAFVIFFHFLTIALKKFANFIDILLTIFEHSIRSFEIVFQMTITALF